MRKQLFLLLALPLLAQCTPNRKALIPRQENQFVRIYKPQGDHFFGPTTTYLEEGKWYDEWVANDHTFIQDDKGRWHIFGITHPEVLTDPLSLGIHDGEYASFHAISTATTFAQSVEENHYNDLPKVLTPADRPDEILPNHAPYIINRDGVYTMVYGHSPIRLATSTDLMQWRSQGELFSDDEGARDPNILYHEGVYYICYCSTHCVKMVSSTDFKQWSEPTVIFETGGFDPESPSLIYHNNTFYLFVCSWDGGWDEQEIVGAYQHRTHVYRSDKLNNFGTGSAQEITILNAHAPEIFQDEKGNWYISSVEWPQRGVSVDRLYWE